MDLVSQNLVGLCLLILSVCASILNHVVGDPFPHGPRKKLQPSFLPTPNNVTVHRGGLAVLRCHIKDLGPKMVVWRKKSEDIPLTIGPEIFAPKDEMVIDKEDMSESESRWDLLIKNVKPSHGGTYLCQVSASKLYTKYITLNVLDKQITLKPSLSVNGTEYVNQDSQIHLTCVATGGIRVPDDVDWFFKGERIVTTQTHWHDRARILKRKEGRVFTSELIVERSTTKDMGNYVCRSSDLAVDSLNVHVLSEEDEFDRGVKYRRNHLQSIKDIHSSPGKDNVSRRVSGSGDSQSAHTLNSASTASLDLPALLVLILISLFTFHR